MKSTLTKQIREEILAELKGEKGKVTDISGVPRAGGARVNKENAQLGDTSDSDFSAMFSENFGGQA